MSAYKTSHGWTPSVGNPFDDGARCRVMLARYVCPYAKDEHDPAKPPENVDWLGYRRPAPKRGETAMNAKPQLHTLYRFWTLAADDEEVDQEWDGWWSGRYWHALYDVGIWDSQFVVRWEPMPAPSGEAAEPTPPAADDRDGGA